MRKIENIYETGKVRDYLNSRQIIDQYKKAKKLLLSGYPQKFDFKIRKPISEDIYQFRINQKYRAFWYFEWETFFVFKISDHQDF